MDDLCTVLFLTMRVECSAHRWFRFRLLWKMKVIGRKVNAALTSSGERQIHVQARSHRPRWGGGMTSGPDIARVKHNIARLGIGYSATILYSAFQIKGVVQKPTYFATVGVAS